MAPSVAHLAPIFSTVPPSGYGGVERVIEELSASQADEGLDVVVLASADSRPTASHAGRYASIRSRAPALSLAETFEELRRHYAWAFDEAGRRGVDVVHTHGPWGLDWLPAGFPLPVVASIYDDTGRPDVSEPLLSVPAGVSLVANSASSRGKAPHVPWFATVLEGVRLDRYPFAAEPAGDYCCFVGELNADKGVDIAIAAAAAAEVPLKIIGRPRALDVPAGEVAAQEAFLAEHVWPCLDGERCQYLGELGEDRLPVLAGARALLAPMRIEEPFGRVMAEAMACGTPAIAFRRGAAPEVIRDGVSGFCVDSPADMVTALSRAAGLSRAACRAHVERELAMTRVVRQYTDIYRSAVA